MERILRRVYIRKRSTTLYIANRAFDGTRKCSSIYRHTKSLIWLLRMNKLKTKYNALAQCKLESSMLSTALLAIYKSLGEIEDIKYLPDFHKVELIADNLINDK